MSNKMEKVLSRLFGFFDYIRGDKSYRRVKTIRDDFTCLRVVSAFGQQVIIHIKRNTYVVMYKRRLFGQRKFRIFEVHALMPDDAPVKLAKHMAMPIHFPNLLPSGSSDTNQVSAAAMAFLDIKMKELNS